jgi:hypothetical protein
MIGHGHGDLQFQVTAYKLISFIGMMQSLQIGGTVF